MDTDSVIGSVVSLNIPKTVPIEKSRRVTDKGYAWVIMIAAFMTFVFQTSTNSTSTLIYQEFLVRFEMSAATASWILSLPNAIRFLGSPLVALLYQKFSHRVVAMIGGLLYTFGILFQGFATGLWMLYVGSVSIGVGSGMVVMSSFVIVPMYFSSKRSFAMSFALCGLGVGAMSYPPLVALGFSNLGYTQTMIWMAGANLQMVISIALYRPQPLDDVATNTDCTPNSKLQTFLQRSGINLLGRPVLVLLMLVVAAVHCMALAILLFSSGLGFEVANMTRNEVALAVSIGSFCGFAKLPFGACFDLQCLKPYRMYIWCFANIVFGLLAVAMAFMSNAISFITLFALYFAMMSCTHGQYVTVLGDMVTTKELQSAIALTRTLSGITLLLVPPAIGKIKDSWDSLQYGVILMSMGHVAIVIIYVITYFCWNKCKKNETPKHKNEEHA